MQPQNKNNLGHFWSSKNPYFQNEAKVEHLTSFWYRGPVELGNGLLYWLFQMSATADLSWLDFGMTLEQL